MPIQHPDDQLPTSLDESSPTAVSLKGVSYTYPDGNEALQDVHLQINQYEKVALVGPNGAGKSTLMLQLNGVYQGSGDIQIMGCSLDDKNLPLIRSRIGLVFQNPDDQLFSPTVFDDVAFGPLHMGYPGDEVHERVHEALQQVGMLEYAQRLSYHLSLGEKKRIAIATVLSMRPDILVFDEPTSGLDPRSRRSLIQLLDDMQLTMLVSTHDMRLVEELFPRMVIMNQGKIVADGPTRELLSDEEFLHQNGLEKP